MPPSSSHQLAELRKELLGTITRGHDALANQIRVTDERITTRLDRINGSVGKAHERLAAHATRIDNLQREVTDARARWHERMNAMSDTLAKIAHRAFRPHTDADDEAEQLVRRADLRLLIGIIIGCISGTAAVIVFFLELFGKL